MVDFLYENFSGLDVEEKVNIRQNVVDLLKNGLCDVEFVKKDGTIRKLTCTINHDLIPKPDTYKQVSKTQKKPKETDLNFCNVYVPEEKSWKRFGYGNLISIHPIE